MRDGGKDLLRSMKLLSFSIALLLRLLFLLWSPPPATTMDNGDQTVWRQYSRWAPRATAWRPQIPVGRMVAAMVELFGLEMDAQYCDCTASVASFVCARSFCACTRVRCMRKNFKEALTLSKNACSGIIVPPNLRLFRAPALAVRSTPRPTARHTLSCRDMDGRPLCREDLSDAPRKEDPSPEPQPR